MFKYLIVPDDQNQLPIILAFTIQNNVITGYYTSEPFLYTLLDKIPFINHIALQFHPHYQFVQCIKDYQREQPGILIDLHDNHPYHAYLHDTDEEKKLNHFHYEFKGKISEAILKDFLEQLQKCNKLNSFSTGYQFISKAVIDDILLKFKKNSDQYTSNSYEYKQPLDQFVKLSDHVAVIDSGFSVYQPTAARLAATSQTSSQLNSTQFFSGAISLLAIGFGIFAARRCFRQEQTTIQNHVKEDPISVKSYRRKK